MARYVYRCKSDHETEINRPVDRRDETLICSTCGAATKRLLFPRQFHRFTPQGPLGDSSRPQPKFGDIEPTKNRTAVSMRGGRAFSPTYD